MYVKTDIRAKQIVYNLKWYESIQWKVVSAGTNFRSI